jgi:hypothetical protein
MASSIREALNELPTTLDDTYERALQEIRKEKWRYVHRVSQCWVAAIRPLRGDELVEMFAISVRKDPGSECSDVSSCVILGCRPASSKQNKQGLSISTPLYILPWKYLKPLPCKPLPPNPISKPAY